MSMFSCTFFWFTENLDYSKTIATLTFKKGSEGGTRLIFTVPIIDDNIAEYYEQFRVTASVLGNDTGIYTQESHTEYVRVYDNDRKLVFLLIRLYFMCLWYTL